MNPTLASNLQNMFVRQPEETSQIRTRHRRIETKLPAPESLEQLALAADLFPQVNCYQAPIVWESADGFCVCDAAGNRWIDFSSTAVMTNTGHGHKQIREAVQKHADAGLLAQFSFASAIRTELAERLIDLAPAGCEKVYFWTVGSEAIECAFRLARARGMQRDPQKYHVLTHSGDYHGWTLAAHQLSGDSARKPWIACPDAGIHHLPFPRMPGSRSDRGEGEWAAFFDQSIHELENSGIPSDQVAAIFIETLQGWGALPLPTSYVQRLRQWADDHEVLVIFDEVQTGFGRTGRWFGHEHYDVRADLLCVGKGLTSSLPLAAVLGPADVLDALPPGEVTTTHAGHPLSCAAALANLRVLEEDRLVEETARKGQIAMAELQKLQQRFPAHVSEVSGRGLLLAVHVRNPQTGEPDPNLAGDWTWAAVKRGVMLFQTNRATLKVCPPLVIPDDALIEGISALGEALQSLTAD